MKKFIAEFKEFAVKGNVVDMAVGVLIGASFSKIVSSLVGDIVTPLLSIILGAGQFKDLSFMIGEVVIPYGLFIQNVFDFTIVAFIVFLFVKLINHFKKKEAAKVVEPTISSTDSLLMEIRDELKKK